MWSEKNRKGCQVALIFLLPKWIVMIGIGITLLEMDTGTLVFSSKRFRDDDISGIYGQYCVFGNCGYELWSMICSILMESSLKSNIHMDYFIELDRQ